MDEIERDGLAERVAAALQGNAHDQRLTLILAVDALRSGAALSPGLRDWLADGLAGVLGAVESGDSTAAAQALAPFGLVSAPPHRQAATARLLARDLAMSSAVHLLTPHAGGKTAAVELVASAVPCDAMTVWRACKGDDWSGSPPASTDELDGPRIVADVVLRRLADMCRRQPGLYSQEVRRFLSVT